MESIQIFPWTRNLETGIPLIDEQHRRLVQLINLLADHFSFHTDLPGLSGIFDEMAQYAAYHFASEEAVWHEYFADDAWEAEHEASHRSFIEQVGRLQAVQGDRPPEELLHEILSFLTHWLAFHILDSDKRLARVVLLMQQGMSLAEAKVESEKWMGGAVKVMVDTVLSMYASLSNSTLRLMKEIIARQKVEARLRLAASVFDNTLESICVINREHRIVEANPAFCQVCQVAYDDLVGRDIAAVKSGLAEVQGAARIWQAVARDGHWSGELRSRTADGEQYVELMTLSAVRDEEGELVSYVGMFSNVDQFIRREHVLEHMANHDALTGLPNRLLLADRLHLALANAERRGEILAVCFADLDGFKPINDLHGHLAGDEVLREMARRMTEFLRGNDTVARLGGDEFVLLVGGLHRIKDCSTFVERLLASIARPVELAGGEALLSASIGISCYPADGNRPEILLQKADMAMYRAKCAGKSSYRFYSEER